MGFRKKRVQGILLLYLNQFGINASTIIEHIHSFERYSKYMVWGINTYYGFPRGLDKLDFDIIVFHYSIDPLKAVLKGQLGEYLKGCQRSYKIAFFQDEYWYCKERFEFIKEYDIDCIYSLLEPEYFAEVYTKNTGVSSIEYCIPGYVEEEMVKRAQQFAKPYDERTIDIGYRGRPIPYYCGAGAQEKSDIARIFTEKAMGLDFVLDLASKEEERLYGDNWDSFVGNCKAMLGVEAGVSIFDLDGEVKRGYECLLAENPHMSFDEMEEQFLYQYEDNIYYRTISPRHFEAAAYRTCQILYEGNYSGVMKPMVHYIPLKKDFSNFKQIIEMLGDHEMVKRITENAYRDLILSGNYSYKKFINEFDKCLDMQGLSNEIEEREISRVSTLLEHGLNYRIAKTWLKEKIVQLILKLIAERFPGHTYLVQALEYVRRK